jgi:hypothetical protein
MDIAVADDQMKEFIRDFDPTLAYFLPRSVDDAGDI